MTPQTPKKFPPLRSWEEIQRAHDLLGELLLGPRQILERVVDQDKVEQVIASLDVLCWVLNHNHNRSFAANLEDVEKLAEAQGLVLRDLDEEPVQ